MTVDLIRHFEGLRIQESQQSHLSNYADLLGHTFQKFKPTVEYLNWLYFKNPRGPLVGFDAFDGEKLVGHYACIPTKFQGFKRNSLLSLNTATHPEYQGRGIFQILASNTYASAEKDFANVVGVANNNSLGGFVRKLGFQKIGNLELRFGFLNRQFEGSRVFTDDDLNWRTSCPERPMKIRKIKPGLNVASVKVSAYLPSLQSFIFQTGATPGERQFPKLGMTLDWRRDYTPIIKLPNKFKPSPLALIFKPLQETDATRISSFAFPDFDAY
jgi:hypothetical protein